MTERTWRSVELASGEVRQYGDETVWQLYLNRWNYWELRQRRAKHVRPGDYVLDSADEWQKVIRVQTQTVRPADAGEDRHSK